MSNMAEYSEGEAEIEGEEFEGEDAGQPVLRALPVTQEPPPDSDSKKKIKGKRKKPLAPIRINLSACKYEVLRIVQRKLGWKEVGDEDDWEVYWTDTSVGIERIMKLTRVQKINHFSGMLEICRKRAMARNLMKMARQFPQHFDFFPRTFILPGDKEEFLADIRTRGKKQVYILKPDAGCQGRGIRLVQGGKDEQVVTRVLNEMATPNVVAQHYLTAPLLIHGYKFDLRIYALVLSCDPMRVFLFHEGLARICTEKYSPPKAANLDVSYMHLTNYAVNKKNEAFVAAGAANADSGEDASKWCLAQLRQYMTSLGYDYDKAWADIADLIIKSLCSVQPLLRNNYRSVLPPDNDGFSCFEILGYDVMLDDQLRPWLIEVNHSPSFNIDSPLDLAIKEELITQTIELVRVDPKIIAKTKKAEKRAATSRLLEPMHVKKAQQARQGGPMGGAAAAGSGSTSGQVEGKGDGEEGGAGGGATASATGFAKPRTPEEYEAWRAKVLAARERYESKHMGNFTRIFPSPDATKQALYEELLKGSSEIYQASFQARPTRPNAMDEKKRKEDAETDAQKAERLKAKAHRDKLAQMAVERRKIKLLQQQQAQGGQLLPAYLNPPQPYLSTGQQQQQQAGNIMYYVPMPSGPYQYDPAVYQQYYYQHAYLYGNAGGGQRMSEVYGERSDGAASASSSRPVSALSTGSGGGGEMMMGGPGHSQQQPPIRIYSGPLARAAASASSGQRPGSSAANSGRSSPMAQHAQSNMAQQQQLQIQLQQQGALPLHPFLGTPRRPSSATSRASAGTGAGGEGLEWAEPSAGGRAAAAAGGRTASPSTFAPGAASSFPAGRGVGGVGGASGSHSFSYGHASALQHLQDLQQANAAHAQSQPARPVSVGSAHNHVRHAHTTTFEAAGPVYSGIPSHQDLGSGEREQPGPGGGTARGLFVNGSRPPSASPGPASLRDKLQPGSGGAAAVAGGGSGGSASTGPSRRQSFAVALGGGAVAAAATWDATMAAAAAAAGQDPNTVMQYFGGRPRPESAGHRLRPTSAASAPRSPSPLGALPSGAAAAALSGLSPSGGGGGPGSPSISRTGSGRYGGAECYGMGLTYTLIQQGQQPLATGASCGGSGGSPKLMNGSGSGMTPPSPRAFPAPSGAAATMTASSGSGGAAAGSAVGPWDPGTAAAAAGRAYKQSRTTGVPAYPALTPRCNVQVMPGPAASGPLIQPPPLQQLASAPLLAPRRRSDDDSGDEDGSPFMYQTLAVPDANTAFAPERYNGGSTTTTTTSNNNNRHWSAASTTTTAAAQAGARQRSFTGTGGYVPAVVVTGTSSTGGGGGAGPTGGGGSSPGSLTARPPVYPPPGGGPGLRSTGAPSSGRGGGGGASSGGGVSSGGGGVSSGGAGGTLVKVGSGGAAVGRLNTNLSPSLPGAGAGAHVGLSVAGSMMGRGGGGGGAGALQGGIEGLQINATGLDLDYQLRSAALAALNRKGLTVKGRKVAQQ